MIDPRHSRQARLAEVGAAGQEAIGAASVTVSGSGLAAEVEANYLKAAGIGTVSQDANAPRNESSTPDIEAFGVLDTSAKKVLEGAYRALLKLRAIVDEVNR